MMLISDKVEMRIYELYDPSYRDKYVCDLVEHKDIIVEIYKELAPHAYVIVHSTCYIVVGNLPRLIPVMVGRKYKEYVAFRGFYTIVRETPRLFARTGFLKLSMQDVKEVLNWMRDE